MKKIFVSFSLIVLAACAAKKVATKPETPVVVNYQADANRGAQKFTGYNLADFTKGKSLYEGNCALCHNLKNPLEFGEKKWRHEVDDMVPKVNGKMGTQVLGENEKELIFKYVITMGPMRNPNTN